MILQLMQEEAYLPMKEKELAIFLQVKSEDRDELKKVLDALLSDGKIQLSKRGHYSYAEKSFTCGTFESTKSGYGFVIPDNRNYKQDIFVAAADTMGAVDGHKVVVQIVTPAEENRRPEGKITEILGHVNDPGVDILSLTRAYDLPEQFPEKVLAQAEKIPEMVSEEEIAGRRDFREMPMVTIDSESAKDLDDAVSLTKEGDVYHLGVHIADVSHYVKESSALDKEALKRGTSIYLTDRVIPMLPHRLCNGICSLNEAQNRLTMSCLMTIDAKGNVTDHEIVESVICTNHRMTYTDVNKIITDHDPDLCAQYEDVAPMLIDMEELAVILRQKRRQRGSIDFDIPETEILLDKTGKPTDVRAYDRNEATKLIEEFMLIANETVAEHYYWQELPFIYRTHEKPDPEKIKKLMQFIRNFGYSIKSRGDEVHPKELQKLLDQIEGTPEEMMISRLTLRSMQRAEYQTECLGHYGLACNFYCHFTSPIRRYPDLAIHRIIKESIHGFNEKKIVRYQGLLPEVAKQSTKMERRADEAERECDKLKKAQYMQDHIGEIYAGVISSVTGWGLYVELPNTVEGLVHISKLENDFYTYHKDTNEMVGEQHGHKYVLGQKVTIRVDSVDLAIRGVDFSIVDEAPADTDPE
ncbi:MAG: ribonuclease R [Lachnospiraceae bacterium]|nr:ribonuclease R [Lachnospiraceae bacterium]